LRCGCSRELRRAWLQCRYAIANSEPSASAHPNPDDGGPNAVADHPGTDDISVRLSNQYADLNLADRFSEYHIPYRRWRHVFAHCGAYW